MRARLLRGIVFAAALGLAACSGAGSGTGTGTGERGQIGSGTPREFTRNDSAVTVLPNANPGFTATQVVTISSDDGGATRAEVSLASRVGSVTSVPAASGYQVQVTLRADAPTDAQAREALATMTVVHRDSLGSGTLYLDHEVRFAAYDKPGVNRAADVAASLPGALSYRRLHQNTAVGEAGSSGLNGSYAQLRSDTGDVALAGTWDTAEADSDTGDATVNGNVASLQATTNTGNVQVSLPGTRTSRAVLDSDTGSIEVTVGRTVGTVFDLEASTQVGSATIVVAGTNPVGEQTDEHAHYRSPDYGSGTPQVSVVGRTEVGSVSIHE